MRTFRPFFSLTIILVVAACVALCGCGLMKSKDDADGTLTRHFQAISTNGFTQALSDYGSAFFQKTSKEEWTRELSRYVSQVGTYQSHTIISWRSFSDFGAAGSVTRVSLQCQVVYSKRTVRESFELFKGTADSDFKIVAHQINAATLSKD